MGLAASSGREPVELSRAEILAGAASGENRRFVLETLALMSDDPVWKRTIEGCVSDGKIETRTVVSWLAAHLAPGSYLEIGVRRGFSMAMVARHCPDALIFGFDMWLQDYAGVENPGPDFVRAELQRVGYRRSPLFVSGDSHKTLPAFFKGRSGFFGRRSIRDAIAAKPPSIDLVLVDGDHSLLGAYRDLHDVLPNVSVGGAVVFDDIAPDLAAIDEREMLLERGKDPHGWGDLLGVWRKVEKEFPTFRFYEFTENPPGVGIAVRIA